MERWTGDRVETIGPGPVAGTLAGAGRYWQGLLGVLFPALCRICDSRLADGEPALCENCRSSRFEPAAIRSGIRPPIHPWYLKFRTALWSLKSSPGLQPLLYRLKYGGDRAIGIDFGLQIGALLDRHSVTAQADSCRFPVLVPVPLHPSRERQRGFNQSRLIAEGVSRVTGWPVLPAGRLVKAVDSGSQTGFGRMERRLNPEGTFIWKGGAILPEELPVIVDDVYTTGATVRAVGDVLRQAGAQQLGVVTLADV